MFVQGILTEGGMLSALDLLIKVTRLGKYYFQYKKELIKTS